MKRNVILGVLIYSYGPLCRPLGPNGDDYMFVKILFRYGELIRLSPGGGGRCGRERGMGGQDGLRAGADAR